MRDRAWFVRMYREINPGLSRVEYRPYRRSNHALSYLYHDISCRPCTLRGTICSRVGDMYLGTVLRLCATGINDICAAGKNINPRFRIKINASYIVSTEGDVRRVTALAVEATEICIYTVFCIRGIQALQGEILLSPSCKISYFSLPVVHYNRYTCILLR